MFVLHSAREQPADTGVTRAGDSGSAPDLMIMEAHKVSVTVDTESPTTLAW